MVHHGKKGISCNVWFMPMTEKAYVAVKLFVWLTEVRE